MVIYSGKNAVIVGGTHDIGLATAKLLLGNGAKVILTGRRSGPVQTAKEDLPQHLRCGPAVQHHLYV